MKMHNVENVKFSVNNDKSENTAEGERPARCREAGGSAPRDDHRPGECPGHHLGEPHGLGGRAVEGEVRPRLLPAEPERLCRLVRHERPARPHPGSFRREALDREGREAFEASSLADELDLGGARTEPGRRARLFPFFPSHSTWPLTLPLAFQNQFRGTFIGFAGKWPGIPDRLRDQEIPAGLRRSALLRGDGIPQYCVLGRCPAGFPTACAIRTSRPTPLGNRPLRGRSQSLSRASDGRPGARLPSVRLYLFKEISAGLPATVHRPSMVVGDLRTGKVIHFQVFYYLAEFFSGLKTWGVVPRTAGIRLDIIPSDYVARGLHLSSSRQAPLALLPPLLRQKLPSGHRTDPEPAELLPVAGAASAPRLQVAGCASCTPSPGHPRRSTRSAAQPVGPSFLLDYLDRDPQDFDNARTCNFYAGQQVGTAGGGGST